MSVSIEPFKFVKNIMKRLHSNPLLETNNFNDPFQKFHKSFVYNLPACLRYFYIRFTAILYEKFYRLLSTVSQLFLEYYVIDGIDKYSKSKIKIIFISGIGYDKYLLDKIFETNPTITNNGLISIRKFDKFITKYAGEVDLILIKTRKFYLNYLNKLNMNVIPEFINITVDISKPLKIISNFFSKSINEDIRKYKKNNFSCEFTCDSDKFDYFYKTMYIPYTNKRFEDSALIVNYKNLRNILYLNGSLLLVKKDGKNILGSISNRKGEIVRGDCFGITTYGMKFIKYGIMAGAIYETIKWSQKNHCTKLEMGATRPFLKDGAFQYKRKWGGFINNKIPWYISIYGIKKCRNVHLYKNILNDNPHISIESNMFKSIIYISKNDYLNEIEIQKLINKYRINGIDIELRYLDSI